MSMPRVGSFTLAYETYLVVVSDFRLVVILCEDWEKPGDPDAACERFDVWDGLPGEAELVGLLEPADVDGGGFGIF
jgi:hypothetical protein